MSTVDIRMTFTRSGLNFVNLAEQEIRRSLEAAGQHMVGAVKKKLRGQRDGRKYPVPGTGRYKATRGRIITRRRVPGTGTYYFASQPDQSPAIRLGYLRNSINYKLSADGRSVRVGTPLNKYPAALEFGTRDGKILKRPFIRPTFDEERLAVIRILKRRWN